MFTDPLWGETTGDQWIPSQRESNVESVCMIRQREWMASHEPLSPWLCGYEYPFAKENNLNGLRRNTISCVLC